MWAAYGHALIHTHLIYTYTTALSKSQEPIDVLFRYYLNNKKTMHSPHNITDTNLDQLISYYNIYTYCEHCDLMQSGFYSGCLARSSYTSLNGHVSWCHVLCPCMHSIICTYKLDPKLHSAEPIVHLKFIVTICTPNM